MRCKRKWFQIYVWRLENSNRQKYISKRKRGPKCKNNVYDLCRARMFSILSGGLVEALFHGLWGESVERRSPKNDSPRGLVWTEKRRTEFSIS